MTNYDQLVAAYEVDVRFPNVSGMEHLEMLCTRSDIARGATHLTAEQRARLAEADKLLLQQARRFYQAIQHIADLEAWRRQHSICLMDRVSSLKTTWSQGRAFHQKGPHQHEPVQRNCAHWQSRMGKWDACRHYRVLTGAECERTAGRSAPVGVRQALAGSVTTATVFPSMSKNSTL